MVHKSFTLRKHIAALLQRYYDLEKKQRTFVAGKTKVRYSGGYFGAEEAVAVVNTFLDGWLGMGVVGEEFEMKLAKYLATEKTLVTNSGSSASLLAMAALTSRLRPDPLKPGDEVITPACTFATTVSAIVRQGLIHRFVDVEIDTLNPNIAMIEAAMRKRNRAVLIPHTLGNPNDM